jgi:hypothetical protein
MALGVDDMRAGRVVLKATLLTLGTFGFTFCLTLLYLSMRSVMDVGGSCASGGPYQVQTACPEGVAWVTPVSIFVGIASVGIGCLGMFSKGGPRPFAFAWSALFLALGWNFLEYGFDPPGGGTSPSWLVCGVVFVAMGGIPLIGLLSPAGARWSLWGPANDGPSDGPRPYPRTRAGIAQVASTVTGIVTPTPTPTAASAPAPTRASASAPTPGAPGEPDDVVARLERLADLHERGALDDAQFELAKNAILQEGHAG